MHQLDVQVETSKFYEIHSFHFLRMSEILQNNYKCLTLHGKEDVVMYGYNFWTSIYTAKTVGPCHYGYKGHLYKLQAGEVCLSEDTSYILYKKFDIQTSER